MSDEVYVKVVQETEKKLIALYKKPASSGKFGVNKEDIDISFDVFATDGNSPNTTDANSWVQLFGILVQNPQVSAQFDIPRVFKHIAKLMGAKNVEEFTIPTDVSAGVLPTSPILPSTGA